MTLPTIYNPQTVESKWYHFWTEQGYFHADPDAPGKPYCIVIPPPNVTGVLHLGHALDNTLQDILIRWRRMQGYNTLWLPGTDHAGIATQARVEEALAKEGLTKNDLGREEFLRRVWAWKEQYGGTIIQQLKGLGSSCDWERERFTMDDGCSAAVREVFIRLFEKGLIYRGSYLINWCPKCHTTISDIEVEHEEREGNLWHIRYPFADGSGYVEVATTRPETMLGDTAVAVNPDDSRYKGLVGKEIILPVIQRNIPLIADSYVDMSFGTGAVKVTPSHDPNDFEMGERHNLPKVTVIGFDAKMTDEAGKYAGLDRYECRLQLINELEAAGLLVKTEPHLHAVGQCYRCDTIIEPLISKQWFVKMKPLADPAIQAALSGQIRFIPERFTKIYLSWLENIRNWCISRQLWWGHRIPVWYCQDCGAVIAARTEPETCTACNSHRLEQDPDVLDTWFSSALWPFSTLGWPEETKELQRYYPTSVLVTGRDIIFFWVARMIFMGLEFMEREPFAEVLIHGLVLDKFGKKMSKSRPETIVDPQEIIDSYGADTLRFTLTTGTSLGQDQRFQMEKVEGSRNFSNKIWNAARFVLMHHEKNRTNNLVDEFQTSLLNTFTLGEDDQLPVEWLSLADRWILCRLQRVTGEVTACLEKYDLGAAADLIYEFLWNEYCDWYIELAKPRLNQNEQPLEAKISEAVLERVLRQTMELLHPFMPFLTEEVWQALPHQGNSVMITHWPQPQPSLIFNEAEAEMDLIINIVRAIRNLRAESNIPPGKKVTVQLVIDQAKQEIIRENQAVLIQLAGVGEVDYLLKDSLAPEQAISTVVADTIIYIPLAGLIDTGKERGRLSKELQQLEEETLKLEGRIRNPAFAAKAPPAVIIKEEEKLAAFKDKALKIRERLAELA